MVSYLVENLRIFWYESAILVQIWSIRASLAQNIFEECRIRILIRRAANELLHENPIL